jgi:hypothetical protein
MARVVFGLGFLLVLCVGCGGSNSAKPDPDGAVDDASLDADLVADAEPDAPVSCLDGSPEVDAKVLDGNPYYSTVNENFVVGQSFKATADGTLVSIELALRPCQDKAEAMPTAELFEMAEGGDVSLGTATVSGAYAAPETCAVGFDLADDSVEGVVFDFSAACIALDSEKTYRIDVSAPQGGTCVHGGGPATCDGLLAGKSCAMDSDCQPRFNVGDTDGNPYADGVEYSNGAAGTDFDLKFKVTLD